MAAAVAGVARLAGASSAWLSCTIASRASKTSAAGGGNAPMAELRLGFLPAVVSGRVARASWLRHLALLLAVLPLFFQTFHYMIDLPPAYALSKVWPLLTLPLAVPALLWARPAHAGLYLGLLAYGLGVAPLLAAIHLGSSLPEAAAATIRILPLAYGLSVVGLLWLLQPAPAVIERAFLILGAATLATLWALWLTMPASAYRSDPTESQVFYRDIERGFRIVLMMGFALVATFWMARRGLRQHSLLCALGVLASLATMLLIYKQRMVIAAPLVVLGLTCLRGLTPGVRLLALLAGGLAGLAGLFWWSFAGAPQTSDLLGGSLSVRLRSSQLAWDFIADDPWRWLFGVGSTTAYSAVTLAEILGYRNFYLTDIGWLGVVTEFGVVGGGLILAALLYTVLQAHRLAARSGDDFTGALADWSLLMLLVTAIYSPVYAPGEIASLTALVWYLSRRMDGFGR